MVQDSIDQSAYEKVAEAVYAAYRAKTPKSSSFFERASKSLVGGVSGSVRYFSPYPLYFSEGQGSRETDIDGHTYLDCFLCGACHLLGHRPPEILAAVAERAKCGSLVLNPILATEVAEKLQEMVPAAERVRLLNSGTEAVNTAIRFARAFTGRPKIVKNHGIYHGMGDQMLVGLDLRDRPLGGGIPPELVSQTALMNFGDLDRLQALLNEGEIAAVLVDPSMHHGGLWAGDAAYYQSLQTMAREAGALLIFDEVISGFRLAAGGAQEYFGITPDLAVFGKAFGAGEKLGAVVGRADVMAVADTSPDRIPGPFAFQSGTCSDSTIAQATSLAAMTRYQQLGEQGAYVELAKRAHTLGEGLESAFKERGVPCRFNQLGPMVRLFLTDGPFDYAHVSQLPSAPINLFHLALITEGVLTLPGSNDFFLSFAHTDEDIAEIVEATRRVLARFDFASMFASQGR